MLELQKGGEEHRMAVSTRQTIQSLRLSIIRQIIVSISHREGSFFSVGFGFGSDGPNTLNGLPREDNDTRAKDEDDVVTRTGQTISQIMSWRKQDGGILPVVGFTGGI